MNTEFPPVDAPVPGPVATVSVDRWPSEIPLLCLVAVAAFWIWVALAVSLIGIAYAAFLGIFFFVSHIAFITYVRGSAVKLSPRQFPELHARVTELAARAGLATPPDAYLMQAGGSLNAFATKFFRARMIVLFSDLLDACGEDEAARDMVIGHELGHVKSRHLDFHWLLLPGMFVPFLGAAYSRAREFTCDRWGRALCGDAAGASRGLALLAAGGRLGPKVDLAAYIEQKRDLDTGWLTLGRWLGFYPPLSQRVEVLRPDVAVAPFASTRGPVRAVAILLLAGLLPMAGMGFAFWKMADVLKTMGGIHTPTDSAFLTDETDAGESGEPLFSDEEIAAGELRAAADFATLEAVLREEFAESGTHPADDDDFARVWEKRRAGQAQPSDPFTGEPYGYYFSDPSTPAFYSYGPDAEGATGDDLDHLVRFAGSR